MSWTWHSRIYSGIVGCVFPFLNPLVSLRPAQNMSLGRWLLVACFSSVKNHNVSGPHLFPSVTTHAKKSLCFPRTVLHEQKNHFAIGRNSKRCCYHTDLSRFVLPISDPSALNLSQFVGFQDSPNLSKNRKSCWNVRIWRKRAAVRRKNHSNLNKSLGMSMTATDVTQASEQAMLREFLTKHQFKELEDGCHVITWRRSCRGVRKRGRLRRRSESCSRKMTTDPWQAPNLEWYLSSTYYMIYIYRYIDI